MPERVNTEGRAGTGGEIRRGERGKVLRGRTERAEVGAFVRARDDEVDGLVLGRAKVSVETGWDG